MHIESLKLWHWLVIGALTGLAIAAVRIQTGASAPLDTRPGLSLLQFSSLASTPYTPDHPFLRNLTIYPATDNRNFITGEYLHSTGFFSPAQYLPFQLNTPVPFRLPNGPRAPSPTYSVRDYLAQTNPTLPYHYAWYASDPAQLALCTAASTLLIGGLWPLLLRLLTGAGLGRPTPPEPAYDLDRFTPSSNDAPPAPAPLSPEVAARLESLTQSLESQLPASPHPESTPTSAQLTPAILPLSNTPSDPLAAPVPPDAPKDYKGEFYPVARTPQKHDLPD